MTKRLVGYCVLVFVVCGLAGCDTFREVDLTRRHGAGATLTAEDAKETEALVDAVKTVAARSQLVCVDDPQPGVRVMCGPWFHSISVTHADADPVIELHLAHPGGSFGHDADCDEIDRWAQELQALLGEMDASAKLMSCQ